MNSFKRGSREEYYRIWGLELAIEWSAEVHQNVFKKWNNL